MQKRKKNIDSLNIDTFQSTRSGPKNKSPKPGRSKQVTQCAQPPTEAAARYSRSYQNKLNQLPSEAAMEVDMIQSHNNYYSRKCFRVISHDDGMAAFCTVVVANWRTKHNSQSVSSALSRCQPEQIYAVIAIAFRQLCT